MENKLPEGWALIESGELFRQLRGISYKKNQASNIKNEDGILVLRGGNIQDGKIVRNHDDVFVDKGLVKDIQLLKKGDVIIVSSTGSSKLIGKAAHVLEDSDDVSFGAFLTLLRPNKELEFRFFDYFYQTKFYRDSIRDLSGGININNIRKEHLSQIQFPLPPLPEQKRIAAKLDELFGHLDELKTKLDQIPELIKNFRQQVLTQAVTGKLTEEWREGRKFEEDGRQLLERILQERIQAFESGIKQGKKLKKLRGVSEDYELDNKINLPNSWVSTVIDKVGVVQVGATPSRKNNTFWDGDIPWISSGEVANNKIDSTNELISKEGFKNSSVKLNPVGSVLIAMVGEGKTRGQSSLLGIEACTNQNIAAVVFSKTHLVPEYMWFNFLANYERNRSTGRGGNQPALNGVKVGQIQISLPPFEEQQEIVNRVEGLFAVADKIEAQYNSLKTKIDTLPQAILNKAFKGELVPQNPNDEPASVLLERINGIKTGSKKGDKVYKAQELEAPLAAEGKEEYK